MSDDATEWTCEHGTKASDLCEECAHRPATEWVGYEMTICAWEIVPWPCEFEKARRLRAFVATPKREGNE